MKQRKIYKFIVCVLAVIMAMSATSMTTLAAVWTGGMSTVTPARTNDGFYLIQTAEDLAWFTNQVNSDAGNVTMKARLLADIYLNDIEKEDYSNKWTPIANYADTGRAFSGVFDGNGFTVYGLSIDNDKDYQGFFGYLSGAQIKNLTISKAFVSAAEYVGAIAGFSDKSTSITNCAVKTTSIVGVSDVGGITGYLQNKSTVSYCSVEGTINATGNRIGGITGCAFVGSTVSQSYNKAKVNTTGKYTGGIVGTNSGSLLISCYNTGKVVAATYVAGISGNNVGDVASCYNASEVESNTEPAGLVGAVTAFHYAEKVSNSYYDATLYTGKEEHATPLTTDDMKRHSFVDMINGTFGDFYYDYLKANDGYPILSWQVDQNLWDGTMDKPEHSVEGNFYYIENARQLAWFAALVNGTLESGEHDPFANAALSNSIVMNIGSLGEESNKWTPIGTEESQYGGEFHGNGYTIRGMYITSGDCVGLFGVVSATGLVSNLTVAESYIEGGTCVAPVVGLSFGQVERAKVVYTDVVAEKNLGGIVGENYGNITDSSSLKSDVGSETAVNVGGIVGENKEGSVVSTCCSSNNVFGDSYVGGIVGRNNADISDTFNAGHVEAKKSYVGGIAGFADGCTVYNCYNTGDVKGTEVVGGIAGHLRGQAYIDSTYSIGKVTGSRYSNAILGELRNGGVTNSYYDELRVTDENGTKVTDQNAIALRTTKMTGGKSLDNMSGFGRDAWIATEDSDYFIYYPQLMSFNSSPDYDLYDVSVESVSYLKDGLVVKVITNTETAYFKTLAEATEKIGTGTGLVELMETIVISSTASVTGNVTVIPTTESNILRRSKELYEQPFVVKNGGVLNFGSEDDSYATLTIDGNNVTDISGESFAISMVTVEDGGTFNFHNSVAVNNTAKDGAFVYNNSGGTVNFYNGTISGGTAIQLGGVAYNKGTMNIYGTEIINNTAKIGAGVIFNAAGEVNINTGTIISNNISGEGGAFYIGGGTVNILGGDIHTNSATYGGAFDVEGNGKLKLYNGAIYNNTATVQGAAIYANAKVEFYASGSVDPSNDIYLPQGKTITMMAKSDYASVIANITPQTYKEGQRVIDGDYTAMNASLCTIVPQEETVWHINSSGKLTTTEIKYVLTASYFNASDVPYTSLEEALADIGTNPAIITLHDDITVTETILVGSNITFASDGAPHTISAETGIEGPLFKVVNGAVVSFGTHTDDHTTDVLYINGTNITADAIVDATDGSVYIYSGTVIFGADGIDSAIKSNNTIEMYGGKITENNVNVGVIYFSNGTFNFFDGTIFDNTGVGVYADGTFNIYDGAGVDESNIVYLTDGHIINLISYEPEVDEETGEVIPPEIVLPDLIASVDFEKYYVDTQIVNTEKTYDNTLYSGKFKVADSTYTLDEMNYLRADNFVLNSNATIKLRENICVYGFTLGVYTAESLELQFENENIAVVDTHGDFKTGDKKIGTGDSIVLLDADGNIYRKLPVLIYGDVNADGFVDGQDAFITAMYVNGFFSGDDIDIAYIEAMDVNHDGQVTWEDVTIIEKMGVFDGNIEQQMNW